MAILNSNARLLHVINLHAMSRRMMNEKLFSEKLFDELIGLLSLMSFGLLTFGNSHIVPLMLYEAV